MSGALHLHRGALWIGWYEKTAHVVPFDWNGRPLARGFSFRDPRLHRATVRGLALDDDRSVWIADEAASRVRRFSVFGRELGGLGLPLDAPLDERPRGEAVEDRAGRVRRPVGVVATGDSDALELVVASGGTRRHALQVFTRDGVLVATLRPGGDPHGRFRGLSGLARSGRFLAVAEREADRVQVFRDHDFHFAFQPGGRGFRPSDVALLADGRLVVAGEAGVVLCSPAGRPLETLCHPARGGADDAGVDEPLALAVEEHDDPRDARLGVLDRQATRIQIYDLTGRHYGSFSPSPDLPTPARAPTRP